MAQVVHIGKIIMFFDNYIVPAILGIVEGITEFLPISSTGHLVIVNEFIGLNGTFEKMFDVVIQLGAILAVVIYYRHRLLAFITSDDREERMSSFSIWVKATVGVIPALCIGFFTGKYIQEKLFNPYVVSAALVIWGIILILIERKDRKSHMDDIGALGYGTVLLIGLIQCLAMVPGTSRSAATIIGAMMLGASRMVAAEFSFFLAIPTLVAASGYSLVKYGLAMSGMEMVQLAIGLVTSFVVAYAVITVFIRFISHNRFTPFGYYRIVLGITVLVFFLSR